MLRLLKSRINLSFLANPFYIYGISFLLVIVVYLIGWSKIFPPLSAGLILFFTITSALFFSGGKYLGSRRERIINNYQELRPLFIDIMFWLIILLGIIDVTYMGYIPVLDRSHNYREFGMPVIDILFNTLSIFFSVLLFRLLLNTRKWKFLIYFIIILIFQFIFFRRSTIVWIIISSGFVFLLVKQKISLLILISGIVSLPILSYCFGLYGNSRSNLTRSFILDDLGASDCFKASGISQNQYMTYLYISSPMANLQENIDKSKNTGLEKSDFRKFVFYCIVPESFTSRLEGPLRLTPPSCYLISPNLIVGTFFIVSFVTLGWGGMCLMFIYLSFVIILCIQVLKKWNTCGIETFSILCTTTGFLVFSNFLNRMDVLIMLFVYPVLFHILFSGRFRQRNFADQVSK
jgi:hypothetical protein